MMDMCRWRYYEKCVLENIGAEMLSRTHGTADVRAVWTSMAFRRVDIVNHIFHGSAVWHMRAQAQEPL